MSAPRITTLGLLFSAALAAPVLAEDPPKPETPKAAKAKVTKADAPKYYEHVAPILQERCVACHRKNAIGPFELETYKQVAGWSPMIHEVVKNRRMPPWHANPKVGVKFSNDRRLPDAERQLILDWIDGGLKQGDPKAGPKKKVFRDPTAWRIGKPDMVLQIPRPFKVPASGVVQYQYNTVKTNLKEDKWVKALEVQIGAPEVVHHVLVFVIYRVAIFSPDTRGGLKGYFASGLPGETIEPFPLGAAKFLPKGSTLLFQIHYTPNGKEQLDQTKLGIVFAKPGEEVNRRVRTVALHSTRFRIPAGAEAHKVRANYTFRKDQMLLGLTPHMHLRGKAFSYVLRYPDGTAKTILDVPRYDFNWQNTYRLKKPLFVPKGAKMLGVATYDNSANNPANPDPKKAVRFGEQTWQEMMIGYMDVLDPSEADKKAFEEKQAKKESIKGRAFK